MTTNSSASAPDDACPPITAETFGEHLAEAVRLGARIEQILRGLLAFAEHLENEEPAR